MDKAGNIITAEDGNWRFGCRAAAVVLDREGQRVLLHRAVFEDFWSLPGGRIEMGEASVEALKREMREEIGVELEVERLLWATEEFFEYLNRSWHCIGFYYLARLPDGSPLYEHDSWMGMEEFIEDLFVPEEIRAEVNRLELVFQWHDIERLQEVTVFPGFLRERLRALPFGVEHVLRRGD